MLVPEIGGLLKCLIVIDPENAANVGRSLENQTTVLRRKVAGPGMAESHIRLEPVNVSGAETPGHTINFGIVPGNRECDGCVEQNVEVVGVVRVFPEVIAVEQQVRSELLLKSGVELVAEARRDGNACLCAENGLGQSTAPGRAG